MAKQPATPTQAQNAANLDAAFAATVDQPGNPSAVVDSFVPDTEVVIDMRTILLLEAIKPPLAMGRITGLGDILLLHLAITDYDGLSAAHARGEAHQYLWEQAENYTPGQVTRLAAPIQRALEREFEPVAGADDGSQKKTTTPTAGGSPSTTSSPTNTSGRRKSSTASASPAPSATSTPSPTGAAPG